MWAEITNYSRGVILTFYRAVLPSCKSFLVYLKANIALKVKHTEYLMCICDGSVFFLLFYFIVLLRKTPLKSVVLPSLSVYPCQIIKVQETTEKRKWDISTPKNLFPPALSPVQRPLPWVSLAAVMLQVHPNA